MIPVIFRGQTVGWMPPVPMAEDASFYCVPLPSPMLFIWREDAPPPEPPQIEVFEFRIVDRRSSDGVPGELHVGTLRNLLRVPGFRPTDQGLAELQDQR